jgi:DNA (cytosine-5)-methyltransferase 1
VKLISLFSGIGGFELAADAMGWETLASCEINPFGQKVLKYYWPDAYHHDDIHTLTYKLLNEKIGEIKGTRWRTDDIVLVGGFP